MLYFYKQHSLVQPEELHLNGDGVYFNIFTEDSRGEDTTGTLKNIGVLLTDTFVPLSYATVAPDPSISGS